MDVDHYVKLGDWVLTADEKVTHHRDPPIHFFKNEADKSRVFYQTIFKQAELKHIELVTRISEFQLNIHLTTIIRHVLDDKIDKAYMILFIFGYLKDNSELQAKYKSMLFELFPNQTSISEIRANENRKFKQLLWM